METPPQPAGFAVKCHDIDWANISVAFCLDLASEMAQKSVVVHSLSSTAVHGLRLSMLLAFASLYVGKSISSEFVRSAQVLLRIGEFFALTAFFMAFTLSVPFFLKCICWTVYSFSFLVILLSYLNLRKFLAYAYRRYNKTKEDMTQ